MFVSPRLPPFSLSSPPSSLLLQLRRCEASDALTAALARPRLLTVLFFPPSAFSTSTSGPSAAALFRPPCEPHACFCFPQSDCLFISRFTGKLERQKVGIVWPPAARFFFCFVFVFPLNERDGILNTSFP